MCWSNALRYACSTLGEVFETFYVSIMGYADGHAVYLLSGLDKETISSIIVNIEFCLNEVKA